jgi:hypothetical protein
MSEQDRHWDIKRTAQFGATAREVWEVIGGFFTIHEWHPDISETHILPTQTSTRQQRRKLTFPGQDPTTEELDFLDNDNFHYRYHWYEGSWGEAVKNYKASIQVFPGDLDKSCTVVWASTFDHPTDAISEFYLNGFRALLDRFPMPDSKE